MIKVMVIEDEPEIRRLLIKMIEKQEDFQVVSEADSPLAALREYGAFRPEVVFVDVDLNGESGLECARLLTELDPKLKVIFATAHSEYMANAFEIYAFDYLVKPFNMERLARTLAKIRDNVLTDGEKYMRPAADGDGAETVTQPEHYKEKLLIKSKDFVTFVDIKDIILVERYGNATNIITNEGEYKTSVALGALEAKLNPEDFMRCHKSYIVNLSKITRMEPYGRWTYVVRFKGTENTALMTAQNYEELKKRFV